MGDVLSANEVALLSQDDLVDESSALSETLRLPGNVDAGQVALKNLQQRHEVPHGEHVVLELDR